MNDKLQAILPLLNAYLEQDKVAEFIIGITEDLEKRRVGYPGYILFAIATGPQIEIVQYEKDLISYFER